MCPSAIGELVARVDLEGFVDRIVDALSAPLEFVFLWTVPDCTAEGMEGHYMATFTMSIVWIGLLSFIMVDFSTRAGNVFD